MPVNTNITEPNIKSILLSYLSTKNPTSGVLKIVLKLVAPIIKPISLSVPPSSFIQTGSNKKACILKKKRKELMVSRIKFLLSNLEL